MKQVLIHCKPEILNHWQLRDGNIYYTHNVANGEVDLLVDDVDYDPDHYYVDPDEQLCDYYMIDYDLVNCIEAA
jgi:hypothetical protein